METKPTVGFIGLGLMGKPMALNLLRAGYPLFVNTRSRATADDLVAQGAQWDVDALHVAQHTEVIILMLPDPATVEQVALGKGGVFEGARRGLLLVDMGTTGPRLARRLAQVGARQGIEVLDAPVSGGQVGAVQGTLSIMVGGTPEAFGRALPIFQTLGSNVVHVGPAGAGQVAKACNQIIVALTIEAVGEALALAGRSGTNPARVRQALMGGFASSRILELHGQRMLDRNFAPGGRVKTHHKDLQIAIEMAAECDARIPATQNVDRLFQDLMAAGYADEDHSALYRLFADDAAAQQAGPE